MNFFPPLYSIKLTEWVFCGTVCVRIKYPISCGDARTTSTPFNFRLRYKLNVCRCINLDTCVPMKYFLITFPSNTTTSTLNPLPHTTSFSILISKFSRNTFAIPHTQQNFFTFSVSHTFFFTRPKHNTNTQMPKKKVLFVRWVALKKAT